jgi:hypothetical protein
MASTTVVVEREKGFEYRVEATVGVVPSRV